MVYLYRPAGVLKVDRDVRTGADILIGDVPGLYRARCGAMCCTFKVKGDLTMYKVSLLQVHGEVIKRGNQQTCGSSFTISAMCIHI